MIFDLLLVCAMIAIGCCIAFPLGMKYEAWLEERAARDFLREEYE